MTINLPWGPLRPHTKFGPDRLSRFDVYWIQTNKQTDRQAKFIYRFVKPQSKINKFHNEKHGQLLHSWYEKVSKGLNSFIISLTRVRGGGCMFCKFTWNFNKSIFNQDYFISIKPHFPSKDYPYLSFSINLSQRN